MNKKYTFINTAFGVNKVMEVDSSMIQIKIANSFVGVSKHELSNLCSDALDMALKQLNPNSFLIGLATGGRELSVKFYPHIVDGKLALSLGQYGSREKYNNKVTTKVGDITVNTNLPACVQHEWEEYDGEEICFSTYHVEKQIASYFADASEEEQFAIDNEIGYYSE